MIAVEGARNHGLLNISVSDFFETYHWIPCYDEQVKIGEFLGKIDENGFLYITGRCKSVIVTKNGKNIYPEEIEVLINNLPYVTEALVFGYPKGDDLILSAKIVYDEHYVKNNFKDLSKEGFEEKVWNDIKEINTTVPKYKHVKKIIVTDEPMIKTTTAKIKRFEEIEKIIKEKQIEL